MFKQKKPIRFIKNDFITVTEEFQLKNPEKYIERRDLACHLQSTFYTFNTGSI